MKNKVLLIFLAMVLVVSLVGFAACKAEEAPTDVAELEERIAELEAEIEELTAPLEVIEWRVQSSEPATSPWFDPTLTYIRDAVDEMTNGQLKLTLYPTPEPVGPFDIMAAVSTGVLDAGLTVSAYYMGMVPSFAFESPPNTLRSLLEGQVFMYNKGASELMREIWAEHNVYYVGPLGPCPGTALWTTTPINTLADLEGLTIRTYGLMADQLKLMGAEIVSLPGDEIYTAVATGGIDGATFGNVNLMVEAWSLHEVAKYVMNPYITGMYCGCMIVNMDSWNALPDDIKAMFENATRVAAQINGLEAYDRDMESRRWVQEEWGVQFTYLPEEDVAFMAECGITALRNYVEANKDKDPYVEPFLEMMESYMRELGYID